MEPAVRYTLYVYQYLWYFILYKYYIIFANPKKKIKVLTHSVAYPINIHCQITKNREHQIISIIIFFLQTISHPSYNVLLIPLHYLSSNTEIFISKSILSKTTNLECQCPTTVALAKLAFRSTSGLINIEHTLHPQVYTNIIWLSAY